MTGTEFVDEVAGWLADAGYPFDFGTVEPPPRALRKAIERAWVRREASPPGSRYVGGGLVTTRDRWRDALGMRECVRAEGRWGK